MMTKLIYEKLIVTGDGGCGKGEVCKILGKFGYKSVSSSEFVMDYVFEKVGKDLGYKTPKEFWEDRRKDGNREIWFNKIVEYNTPDLSRLGTEIFREYDVYDGIRNINEFIPLTNKFPNVLSIWVDSSKRIEKESSKSMTIKPWHCNVVLDNNGTLNDLEERIYFLYDKSLSTGIINY